MFQFLLLDKRLYFAESLGHTDFIAMKLHFQKVMCDDESAGINEHNGKKWWNNILPELLTPYHERHF